jgi:IS1 family transposase
VYVTTDTLPPPLESLACPFPACEDHAKVNRSNLYVRKYYGSRSLRLLRCLDPKASTFGPGSRRSCGREFSETHSTPMWNTKLTPECFASVAKNIAEGHSASSITRTCNVHHDTVDRIMRATSEQAKVIHDTFSINLRTTALQGDERHGFVGNKSNFFWGGPAREVLYLGQDKATTLDPKSKFLVSLKLGKRDEALISDLMEDSAKRLLNKVDLVFFSDGLPLYESLFPKIFGQPYQPSKTTHLGRPKAIQYRIPRTLAHVLTIKHRDGKKLENVEVSIAHGSQTRVSLERPGPPGAAVGPRQLSRLKYNVGNTSAIERQNGTARQHTMYMGRKGLSFAHLKRSRVAAAEITRLSYNWMRPHSSLRVKLEKAVGTREYDQRTPAMAIGIADKIWTWGQVLSWPVWALPMRNHST